MPLEGEAQNLRCLATVDDLDHQALASHPA
jgi:hypothetical protein